MNHKKHDQLNLVQFSKTLRNRSALSAFILSVFSIFALQGLWLNDGIAKPQAEQTSRLEHAKQKVQKAAVPHPFFWDVKGPNGEIAHLMGTVHVPDERWERLPKDLLADLDRADVVYGELDLTEKNVMNTEIMKVALLSNGQTLEKLIGERLYQKLDRYLQTKGKSAAFMNGFHPKMVEMTLGLLDVMPLLLSGKPVLDEWILQRAKNAGIRTAGVETIQEQVNALFFGTIEDAKASLEFSIETLSKKEAQGIKPFEVLFKAYFTGDEAQVLKTIEDELKGAPASQFKAMEQLLTVRNHRMADRIIERLKQAPKQRQVFAFGVAHFVGDEGVVSLLRKQGFTVHRRYAPKVNH